ncbi:MAG: hypothetical protein EOO38_15485 [Cytophagaceae bacterium]|jgi:hypothetical protein|nr:MAG: hypothetical protein EOO38_15485 [Cytophagaceae bacterium]
MWRPTASRVLLHGDEDLHDPQNNNAQSKRSKSQNTLEALHHKRKTPRVCDSRRAALQQRRNSSQCAILLLASLILDYSLGSYNNVFLADRQGYMHESIDDVLSILCRVALDHRARV